ncbi:MAG TPA: DUF4337 domain-containing protein [Vicinamibacterales bacterium]
MDVDPVGTANDCADDPAAVRDRARAQLNTYVAITVALLATFLGICKVKDDNIVQAMQQAEADRVDHWNFYQARNIREEVGRAELVQLKLAAVAVPAAQQAAYAAAIGSAEALVADQAQKKEELRQQAEQDQRNYDALNFRDDQFDLADALSALAISLLAITALTHKRWLYFLALVPTVGGIAMGLAGLFGWPLHPTLIVRLLS